MIGHALSLVFDQRHAGAAPRGLDLSVEQPMRVGRRWAPPARVWRLITLTSPSPSVGEPHLRDVLHAVLAELRKQILDRHHLLAQIAMEVRPSRTSGSARGSISFRTRSNRKASQSMSTFQPMIVDTRTMPSLIERYSPAIAFCAASAINTSNRTSATAIDPTSRRSRTRKTANRKA
jgi:hypothetical protein